jgi:peroxiredoxin
VTTAISQVPKVGDAAPELRLRTAEGREFDLGGLLGNPVLVTFLGHAA